MTLRESYFSRMLAIVLAERNQMHITFHAADRIQQRSIHNDHMALALEHGDWNSRGDRLTLGKRQATNLLKARRRELKAIEQNHVRRPQSASMRNGE